MIDTKKIRKEGFWRLSIDLVADELDRLYALEADNAPLTREELETVLKEAGWEDSVFMGSPAYEKPKVGRVTISGSRFFLRTPTELHSIPLSAVTRATLRNYGVIK